MKVVYDISVLGVGQYQNRARTGIFRVVENVANRLVDVPGIELTLSAVNKNLGECLGYLAENSKLKNLEISHSDVYVSLLRDMTSLKNEKSERAYHYLRNKLHYKLLKLKFSLAAKLSDFSWVITNNHDIYHSTFYPIPEYLSAIKSISKFITVYDLIPLMRSDFFEFNEDHLLRNVVSSIDRDTWVFAISNSTKQDLCNYSRNVDPDKVLVTHLAASESFFPCSSAAAMQTVKRKYGIPDQPYLLSCCTLEPRKNIDQTITCFTRLIRQEHLTDLCLVLVGAKGWDYEKIFNTIADNREFAGRILVTGYVADADLAALYSGALAFVYPSFYEGFGLPPLEAMQCGTPVLTSNTSSLPEVVGDAGIMVAPSDGDALCQAMLHIYRDSALRAELSLRSLARAQHFSWARCVEQTVAGYRIAQS